MHLRTLFCFALLSIPQFVIGQNIEHYKYVAQTESNVDLKLEALDSVISKSYGKDSDTFIESSLQFIEVAKREGAIEMAAKKAINLQRTLTYDGNDPIKATRVITGVLAYKYKIKDSFLLGRLYYKKAAAKGTLSLSDAVKDYTLAIEHFSQKDTVHIADTYLFRGQSNSKLGNFIDAGKDFNKAYSLYQSVKDYKYMLYAQQGNIIMWSKNGFYEEAKKERIKYINKAIELNRQEDLTVEYYNQAVDYTKMGEDDLALENLLLAKENLNNVEKDDFLLFIYAMLCEHYLEQGEVEEGTEYYILMNTKKFNEERELEKTMVFYGAKAKYLETIGEYEFALNAGLKKLKSAEKYGHSEGIFNAHLLLSEIYSKLGDYDKALSNKNEYVRLKELTFNDINTKSLAFYQTLYKAEKNEKELVKKTTNIERLKSQNDVFRKQSIYLSVAGVLLFGVIILYRAQRQHKNNIILQERFSQDLLASQENERKRISNDLHDGLGQSLLVLKNKLILKGDLESQKIVDITIEEVRTISRDLHPFQLQELGITKAIEHTISEIDENTSIFISSEIDNIDNLFNKEQEVNIYRIVQEGLSNVVKHATAEATKVTVKKTANSVMIAIRDNGKSFDVTEKYKDTKSLGLKTLLERTKSLKGQMKVQSKKESGTLIVFKFPI